MKLLLLSIVALIFVGLVGCNSGGSYKIEQTVQYESPYFLCESLNGCFVTYVWKNKKIIASWYDHPLTVTDSLKAARIQDAKNAIAQDKLNKDTIIHVK